MDPVWQWWIGERGGAVCGERKQAGWARTGHIQKLILDRVLFLLTLSLSCVVPTTPTVVI